MVERWRHRVAPWSPLTRFEWLLRHAGIPDHRVATTGFHEHRLEAIPAASVLEAWRRRAGRTAGGSPSTR